jgi:putative transcriptional regulator
MRGKRGATVSISERQAKAAKIDWGKVDATSESEIARHAREDGTRPPSDRAWREMLDEGRVTVPPAQVDVRSIRNRLQLSQSEFAARFGFTASAVRQWEQGRRYPHGPARVLLTIIDREPDAVRRALERG